MAHVYYSHRTGSNPNPKGLPLSVIVDLVGKVYGQMEEDGYFTEAFGFHCVDLDFVPGKVKDIPLEILISVRKQDLWPIQTSSYRYSEDDLFDIVEFLYQHVSKPIDGTLHRHDGCGMHWETFNKSDGRVEFRERINQVLSHYEKPFELSPNGEVLSKVEAGFEKMFEADLPSSDKNVVQRVEAAVHAFRRHGATLDARRQAVRDLADVFEYLRPKVQELLTAQDEKDLFNLANNFAIRHHNDKQKTGYDRALWLSWMFYFYLATVHLLLRKIGQDIQVTGGERA